MLTWLGILPNPIVYLRADVGTVALLFGGMVTLASLTIWWSAKRHRAQLVAVRSAAAAEHRRFLRRLDHELKNPLTAIRVALANLAEGQERSPALLESVERETLRIGRLAADLRKLADVEVGVLESAQVDLAELLREVVAAVEEQGEAAGRSLRLVLPAAPWPLPSVEGDPDLLFLAIHNLVMNALKFSANGDMVEVRAHEQGNQVLIEVADTGCGIPNEEAPHIWDELYRGQGARGTPGSGLGLALVRAIVARHQGHVEMRSRLGQGSVFIVRLPVK
jgi:two-component system OmpR family sensor kinase